jgi:urease accessory protein
VTLLTPAASLLDGDAVELSVEVRAGAHVVLCQASATQLHGGNGEGSRFDAEIQVGAEASFAYLPYELIPFAGSSYRQRFRLHLDQGAEALLTEVVTPGRTWEHFRYRRLDLGTDVCLNGQRIVLDRQHLFPGETDPGLLLGGFTHFATLLHFGSSVGAEEADALHARLVDGGACGSASALPYYGIGARALGMSADELLTALALEPCAGQWASANAAYT